MYKYMATLSRIIDGDTIEAVIDLGFKIKHKVVLRLNGVDAPERNTEGYKEAIDELWPYVEREFVVRTYLTRSGKEKKSFDRYIADIYTTEGDLINENLKHYVKSE